MQTRRFNNLIITALVSMSVIPILVVGLLGLKEARELGQSAIADATEMGLTASQQSREALTDLAAQQLLAHTVTLSQRLNESLDTRTSDIIALSREPVDENIYRRFLELHIGTVHDPTDIRSSDVEPHPAQTISRPVYKSIYVINRRGEVIVGLPVRDDTSRRIHYIDQTNQASVRGDITDNADLAIQQIFERIMLNPSEYRDKLLIAKINTSAADGTERNSNLLASKLANDDYVNRLTNASIRCGTAIFNNGAFAGVLVVDFDWLHIMKLVNDFKFGKFGYAYLQEITGEIADLKQDSTDLYRSNILPNGRIVENGDYLKDVVKGLIIAHPQHNYVGWMDFTTTGIPNLTNLSALQNTLNSGVYKYSYDNRPQLTVYAPVIFNRERLINMNNWSVATTIPVYEIILPALKTEEHIKSKIDLAAAKIKTSTESMGLENAFIFTTILVATISFIIALMISKRLQLQARLEIENVALESNNFKLEQAAAELRAAEERTRQERDRAQQYLDVAGVILLALDKEGKVQMINKKGAELLGYPEDHILGRNWARQFIPEPDRKKALHLFEQMMEGKASSNDAEYGVITSTEEERIISWHHIALHDITGKIYGTLSSGEDITDKKKAEAEKQAMEQKAMVTSRLATVGEMASGIAHEINNPLTAVIGFSEMLKQRNIPDEIKAEINIIHQGATRVSNIISRLLAFARQQKPRRDPVNINDVITTTIELRKYNLENANIEIITQLDPSIQLAVADAGQLQQVFLNLILNAEHAMTEYQGRGKLTIRSEQFDHQLRLTIADDGPGIPPDVLPRIFDPFFTTKEVGKGTGLGLSICHTIIEEHNGSISVNSRVGEGTEFIIELPVVMSKPIKDRDNLIITHRQDFSGNILIVDDDPYVRQYLSHLLTNRGFSSHSAPDAATALTLLKTHKFDAFLLDYKMPGMTGIELLGKIKQMDRRAINKTVLLTGDVMNMDIQDFIKTEELLVLTKPLSSEELLAAIQRIVWESKTNTLSLLEAKKSSLSN